MHEEAIEMSSQTFDKNLDSNAIALLMSMAQKDQYSSPQKSSVREIASNAVDALNEREVAKSILSGRSKVEDHFLPRTEGIYKDSVFNAEYYDMKWLSDLNEVHIIYQNNGSLERDELTIRDFGVGLWGRRLRGYFDLGFSTKRNSRFALGKFGIGAKSALSTGVPFYTMRTRYNGMTTAFNVYLQKVEPITPRFNMSAGTENPSFEMQTGENSFMTVYYEPTNEPNGVDITLQVKKHHKNQYIDAVKSQLMYFKEVRFFEETEGANRHEINVQAKILYEDDVMVISENAFHNRPHLLIDRVNYGNIEFTELELEEKRGNVGIKVKADNVSVNPSRERVIWDDNTKQTILEAFNAVVANAGKRLQDTLKSSSILEWLRMATQIRESYRGNDPVVQAMAGIADFSKLKLGYGPYPDLYSNSMLFEGLSTTFVQSIKKPKGNKTSYSLDRDSILGGSHFRSGSRPIVFRKSSSESVARKNKYISRVLYPEGYIDLVMPYEIKGDEDHVKIKEWSAAGLKYMPSASFRALTGLADYFISEEIMKYTKKKSVRAETRMQFGHDNPETYREMEYRAMERTAKMFNVIVEELLKESKVLWYEDIEVPADFKASEKEADDDEEEVVITNEDYVTEDWAAKRKLEGKILVHTLAADERASRTVDDIDDEGNPIKVTYSSLYKNIKLELPPSLVDTWEYPEIYYCNKEDEELMHTVAMFLPKLPDYASENDRYYVGDSNSSWDSKEFEKRFPGVDFKHTYPVDLHHSKFLRSKEIMVFMVSKEQVKSFTDYKHVREFFMNVKDNTLSMSSLLVKWNTARVIKRYIDELEFCTNFGKLNPDVQAVYEKLEKYADDNFSQFSRAVYGGRQMEELEKYLDNVMQFQLFVRENKDDPEAIALMAHQLLNPAEGVELHDARCLDTEMYDLLMKLLDMSKPVATLLNKVGVLTRSSTIEPELEYELRSYIQYKNAEILLTYKQDQ